MSQQEPATLITEDALRALGCKRTMWNNVMPEWWLPVVGEGRGLRDHRLGVTFGEYRKGEPIVWLVFPGGRYAFEEVKTIEQFCLLYKLLTGKKVNR